MGLITRGRRTRRGRILAVMMAFVMLFSFSYAFATDTATGATGTSTDVIASGGEAVQNAGGSTDPGSAGTPGENSGMENNGMGGGRFPINDFPG